MTDQEKAESEETKTLRTTENAQKSTPYVYVENEGSTRIVHVTIFQDGQVFTMQELTGTTSPEFVYSEGEALTTNQVINTYHSVQQGAAAFDVICTVHVDDKDGNRKTTVIYESPRGGKNT